MPVNVAGVKVGDVLTPLVSSLEASGPPSYDGVASRESDH